MLRKLFLLIRPALAAVVVVTVAVGAVACGSDRTQSASHVRAGPAPADGLALSRTDLRVSGKETRVSVAWERPLDAEARSLRKAAVFVMFFKGREAKPSAMVMTDGRRSIRCGPRQLEPSAPWVFSQTGPFIECPDFPEAVVETTDTSLSMSWPKGAVDLPDDLEWVVRVASQPSGGKPIEEFVPGQAEPVQTWPTERARLANK